MVIKVHSVHKVMQNMFNHLCSLVKCTYVTFIYHIFSVPYQPVVGTLGKFPIGTYFGQNSTFQLGNYGPQSNFDFCPAFNQIHF